MKFGILVTLLVTLLAIPAYSLPAYVSNAQGINAGTYGLTSIPIYIEDDEKKLFDGEYGGYDWMWRDGVKSVDDYWARYDQQNGYAKGWVEWYIYQTPTITFDMGTPFNFWQVGVHGYQRSGGGLVAMPTSINVSFSEDGTTFSDNFEQSFSEPPPDDTVSWRTVSFQPTSARFVRITLSNTYYGTCMLDEISINGMDGTQFAASVPEPSSLLALGAGIAILTTLKRRKRE